MESNNNNDLLQKYNKGLCTDEEKAIVETWFLQWKEEGTPLSHEQIEKINQEVWASILRSEMKTRKINWPLRIASMAAAIVMFISIAVLMLKKEPPISASYANDISPGGNKATLTLANGKTINLSDAKTGIVIDASKLTYNDGTVLLSPSDRARKFTVTTPIGGQYQIKLPDGSKVWLNAASSLTFSTSLKERGEERRMVELSGEAYFEVFEDKKRPFIVETRLQQVEVLGTHFNISAYTDENVVKTTLLEGAVRVKALDALAPLGREEISPERGGVTLKPNQQSTITANSPIKVEEVDVSTAVGWKNGEFTFANEPLESIMRKIARWYNVEVVYENKELANIPFGGSISRFGKVSEVLYMLQLTGKVKFKIDGRKVIVN